MLGSAQVRAPFGPMLQLPPIAPPLSGYHFAEASPFMSVAMSLAALEVSKDVVDGVKITPEVDFGPGAIS